MTVYERIRFLREKLGMSQSDLAIKMGYKSKSAISKVELGERDINQSLVVKYAMALNTTPAYLMGWEDEEKQNPPTELDLSDGEKLLIELFRKLPEESQKMYIEVLRATLKNLTKD